MRFYPARYASVLMIPVAFVVGYVLARPLAPLSVAMGPMLVAMLLLTFLRLRVRELRVQRAQLAVLVAQVGLAPVVFAVLWPLGGDVALAGLILVLTPTATAAPALVGMLRGDVAYVTTTSLLTNTVLSGVMPVAIVLATGGAVRPDVWSTLGMILRVLAVILGPLAAALVLRRTLPEVAARLTARPALPFYLWAFTLAVVTARTVVELEDHPQATGTVVGMAALAAAVCAMNFSAGWAIARLTGSPRPLELAQSMGQKNTLFTIYVALSVLGSPVIALAPTFYILWHNCYNAYQLLRSSRTSGAPAATVPT
ncbi:MAG: bile acid:sodium symporter family protein [Tepidisphaerales bacterium]